MQPPATQIIHCTIFRILAYCAEAADSIKARLCQTVDPDEDSIPLADDDPSAVVDSSETTSEDQVDRRVANWRRGHESLDSIPSMISDSLPASAGPSSLIGLTASHVSEQMTRMCLDPDFSPDETEEKARLISQVSWFPNFIRLRTKNVVHALPLSKTALKCVNVCLP